MAARMPAPNRGPGGTARSSGESTDASAAAAGATSSVVLAGRMGAWARSVAEAKALAEHIAVKTPNASFRKATAADAIAEGCEALAADAATLGAQLDEAVAFEHREAPPPRLTRRARYREPPVGALRRRVLRLKGPSCLPKVIPPLTAETASAASVSGNGPQPSAADGGEDYFLLGHNALRPSLAMADVLAALAPNADSAAGGGLPKPEHGLRAIAVEAQHLENEAPVHAVRQVAPLVSAHLRRQVDTTMQGLAAAAVAPRGSAIVPAVAQAVGRQRRWTMVHTRDVESLAEWKVLEERRVASSARIFKRAQKDEKRLMAGDGAKTLLRLAEDRATAAGRLTEAAAAEAEARAALTRASETMAAAHADIKARDAAISAAQAAHDASLAAAREASAWETFNAASSQKRVVLIVQMLQFYETADGLVRQLQGAQLRAMLRGLRKGLIRLMRDTQGRDTAPSRFVPSVFGVVREATAVRLAIQSRAARELAAMVRRLWAGNELEEALEDEVYKLERWAADAGSSSRKALIAFSDDLLAKLDLGAAATKQLLEGPGSSRSSNGSVGSKKPRFVAPDSQTAWKARLGEHCTSELALALQREQAFTAYCGFRPPQTSAVSVEHLKSLSLDHATRPAVSTVDPAVPRTTQILFYAGPRHLTPEKHFESLARLEACLKALSKQRRSTTTGDARGLDLVCITDIVPPSAELLCLVHAPDYIYGLLTRVSGLADGGVVPLPMDSDWSDSSMSDHNHSDLLDDSDTESDTWSEDEVAFLKGGVDGGGASGQRDSYSGPSATAAPRWRVDASFGARVGTAFGGGQIAGKGLARSDAFVEVDLDFGARAIVLASDITSKPEERRGKNDGSGRDATATPSAPPGTATSVARLAPPGAPPIHTMPVFPVSLGPAEGAVGSVGDEPTLAEELAAEQVLKQRLRAILFAEGLSQRKAAELMKVDPSCMSRFMNGKANKSGRIRVVTRLRTWLDSAEGSAKGGLRRAAAAISGRSPDDGTGPFMKIGEALRQQVLELQTKRGLTDKELAQAVAAVHPDAPLTVTKLRRFLSGFVTPDTPSGKDIFAGLSAFVACRDRALSLPSTTQPGGAAVTTAADLERSARRPRSTARTPVATTAAALATAPAPAPGPGPELTSGSPTPIGSQSGSRSRGKRARRRSRGDVDGLSEATVRDVLVALNEYVDLRDDALVAGSQRRETLIRMVSLVLGIAVDDLGHLAEFLEGMLETLQTQATPGRMPIKDWFDTFGVTAAEIAPPAAKRRRTSSAAGKASLPKASHPKVPQPRASHSTASHPKASHPKASPSEAFAPAASSPPVSQPRSQDGRDAGSKGTSPVVHDLLATLPTPAATAVPLPPPKLFGRGLGEELQHIVQELKVADLRCLVAFELARRRLSPAGVARDLSQFLVDEEDVEDPPTVEELTLSLDALTATDAVASRDLTILLGPLRQWLLGSVGKRHAGTQTDTHVFRLWHTVVFSKVSRFSVLRRLPFGPPSQLPTRPSAAPPAPVACPASATVAAAAVWKTDTTAPMDLHRSPNGRKERSERSEHRDGNEWEGGVTLPVDDIMVGQSLPEPVTQSRNGDQKRSAAPPPLPPPRAVPPPAQSTNPAEQLVDHHLAARARVCIHAVGMSQRSIATSMQVDPSDLSRFVNAKANYSTFLRIRERVLEWVERVEESGIVDPSLMLEAQAPPAAAKAAQGKKRIEGNPVARVEEALRSRSRMVTGRRWTEAEDTALLQACSEIEVEYGEPSACGEIFWAKVNEQACLSRSWEATKRHHHDLVEKKRQRAIRLKRAADAARARAPAPSAPVAALSQNAPPPTPTPRPAAPQSRSAAVAAANVDANVDADADAHADADADAHTYDDGTTLATFPRHGAYCDACSAPGELLCCDGCPRAWHLRCLQHAVEHMAEDVWYCPDCVALEIPALRRALAAAPLLRPRDLQEGDVLRLWKRQGSPTCHGWRDVRLCAQGSKEEGSGTANGSQRRAFRCQIRDRNGQLGPVIQIHLARSFFLPLKLIGRHAGPMPSGVSTANARDARTPPSVAEDVGASPESDTYLSRDSLSAALAASAVACRGVDEVLLHPRSNVFCCVRPPGHHAGLAGATSHASTTGFCLVNNVGLAATYAKLRWGLEKVAVLDFDVHYGNGTAEVLGDGRDESIFFASVHMRHPDDEDFLALRLPPEPEADRSGLYPVGDDTTLSPNFVTLGILPEKYAKKCAEKAAGNALPESGLPTNLFAGRAGFRQALDAEVLPRLRAFQPEILFLSAGFDGYKTDPLGGALGLEVQDYYDMTVAMVEVAEDVCSGRIVSVLEGGYDTGKANGLGKCVDAHVRALRGVRAAEY